MQTFLSRAVSFLVIITFSGLLLAEQPRNHYIDAGDAAGLQKLLRYTGDNVNLFCAHRGGHEPGFPENSIAAFDELLRHCYAYIETDPRYTKDGVIILHHDDTLERTTTGKGKVSDFTYAELKQLKLKDKKGNLTEYGIPTLDEALEWAKGKTILVLDKKDVSIEDRVRKITEHHAEACAMVLVYSWKEVETCYKMNPNVMMQKIFLTDDDFAQFEKLGIPWDNIVGSLGHEEPVDKSIYKKLHDKGRLIKLGTVRTIDREYLGGKVKNIEDLKDKYHALLKEGVDIIETDIPVQLSKIIEQNGSRFRVAVKE